MCMIIGWISWLGFSGFEFRIFLEDSALELLAQALADMDGEDVEQEDQADQQQGGGEDHGLGGLAVLALEAKVVDVEARCMKLRSGWM